MSAIHNTETQWTSKSFYNAGVNASAVMKSTVGPIVQRNTFGNPKPNMLFPPTVPQTLSVIEGFAYRLLLVNDLLEFQRCVDMGPETVNLVQQAWDQFNAGDSMGGSWTATQAIVNAFMGIEDCRDAGNAGEFQAFVQWLDRMTSWNKITEATTEGFHLHAQELEYVTATAKAILF